MKYWSIVRKIFKIKRTTGKGRYQKDGDYVWMTDGYSAWRFTQKDDEKYAEDECIFDLSKFGEFDIKGEMIDKFKDFEDVVKKSVEPKTDDKKNLIKFESKNLSGYYNEDFLKIIDSKDELKLAGLEYYTVLCIFNKGQLVGLILPVRVHDEN